MQYVEMLNFFSTEGRKRKTDKVETAKKKKKGKKE